MKLIKAVEVVKNEKQTIEYYGIKFLALDKNIKWVATDKSGDIYGFASLPYVDGDIWNADIPLADTPLLCRLKKDISDWKNSLLLALQD